MTRVLLIVWLLAPLATFASPPRLTLWITVDGLSSDLLLRHRPQLKGGLAQLMKQGAFFPIARYAYAEPSTAPGHATLASGANPWRHGVVANGRYDRASGKQTPVFADANYPVLEAPLGNEDSGPLALRVETIADRLRASTGERGKAVAIAGKARGAIPFAGRMGQPWWFNPPTGKFVTGTFYSKGFPDWVQAFNDRKLAEAAFTKKWTLSLPPRAYRGSDDRPYEADYLGLGRVFPHPITGGLTAPGERSFKALGFTPLLDELVLEFARAAIAGEKLGSDATPDLLAVSFSAVDKVQHLYGPTSWEVQDAVVKLDRTIAQLLAAAEKAAGGRANLTVVLSADHGSAAIPEAWAAASLPGVRVSPLAIAGEVQKALRAKFGGTTGVWMDETDLYLRGSPQEKGVDGPALRRAAAAMVAAHPSIVFAVARDDLFKAQDGAGDLLEPLRRGFHPDQSGDVLLVFRPFHVPTDESTGTNHGTPWTYDTDVPLILSGKGVKPGVYRQIVAPTDVAPTVASILEMGVPSSAEGRILSEALR